MCVESGSSDGKECIVVMNDAGIAYWEKIFATVSSDSDACVKAERWIALVILASVTIACVKFVVCPFTRTVASAVSGHYRAVVLNRGDASR